MPKERDIVNPIAVMTSGPHAAARTACAYTEIQSATTMNITLLPSNIVAICQAQDRQNDPFVSTEEDVPGAFANTARRMISVRRGCMSTLLNATLC